MVHAYAARCPYCNKDLHSTPSMGKITELPTAAASPIVPMPEAHAIEEEAPSIIPEAFTILVSLAALLAGSFFFFFGVIIKLFATNGTFTLEWNATSWPYFVGFSLVLLALGLYTLSHLEQDA